MFIEMGAVCMNLRFESWFLEDPLGETDQFTSLSSGNYGKF